MIPNLSTIRQWNSTIAVVTVLVIALFSLLPPTGTCRNNGGWHFEGMDNCCPSSTTHTAPSSETCCHHECPSPAALPPVQEKEPPFDQCCEPFTLILDLPKVASSSVQPSLILANTQNAIDWDLPHRLVSPKEKTHSPPPPLSDLSTIRLLL